MADMIQVLIYEGYLGADPVLSYIDSGKEVCNFRLASTHQYRKGEEAVKEVTWLKVTTWGKLAVAVNQLCEKGSHVIVTGRLRPDTNGNPKLYETKDGGSGASFEVVASSVRVIKGRENLSHAEVEEEVAPY